MRIFLRIYGTKR